MEPLYRLMQDDIIAKFGLPVLYSKDCQFLALEIRKLTNRSISSTTIKRFFSLVRSSTVPSRYTLDTFAIYLGFESFIEYINCFDKNKFERPETDSWELFKKRVNILTSISLDSIKLKTAYNSELFVKRNSYGKFLDSFLASDRIITALAAPDGHGKSAAVIQLAEEFFTGDKARYPEDILCLIDGNFFFSLVSKYPDISVLNNLIDFNYKSSLINFFSDNIDSVKGRIVVIIDDFDEVFIDPDRLHHFAGNLMRIVMAYKDQNWYKIMVTLKPENLRYFNYFTERNNALEAQWFGVNFRHSNLAAINIPPVDENELRLMLSAPEYEDLTDEFKSVLTYPYLLYTYLRLRRQLQPADEVAVLENYIRNTVFSGPGMSEKGEFIESFLEVSRFGTRTDHIKKDILFKKVKNSLVYNEFISCGLISEITVYEEHLRYTTYCRFSNTTIFNYLVTGYWIGREMITIGIFNRIGSFYGTNVKRKLAVHRYIILHAIRNGNLEFLKQLHIHYEDMLEKDTVKPDNAGFAYYRILSGIILRQLSIHEKIHDEMMMWYASSRLGRKMYLRQQADAGSAH